MDDLARSRRTFLSPAVACILHAFMWVGCAPESHARIGMSSGGTALRRLADAGTTAVGLPFVSPDYAERFVSVAQVVTSQHGVGQFEARVLARDAATSSALRLGTAMPGDALIIETLRAKPAGALVGALVMKREGDAWRIFALDEKGAVALDPARSPSVAADCAGCHSEAPRDGVFGKF